MTNKYYEKLNKAMDKINIPKNYGSDVFAKTVKYQKKYNFNMGSGKEATHNNEADAFKHTFMQADIALKSTSGISKLLGDYHEYDGNINQGQDPKEENMDKWNNWHGRDIAEHIKQEIPPEQLKELIRTGKIDDVIAEKVYERMKAGKLITNPNDSRNYEKTYGKESPYSKDKKIYTFEEIKQMKPQEFLKNQAKILSDFTSGKIMHESEAKEKVKSGDLIYVHSYKRNDGTNVKSIIEENKLPTTSFLV